MAKKKPVELVTAVPLLTGAAAHERALKAADDVWTKAQEDASHTYDAAMNGAWGRYSTALRAHHAANGKKAKSGGTDFDTQFDKERALALKVWKEVSEKADRKLQSTLDSITV